MASFLTTLMVLVVIMLLFAPNSVVAVIDAIGRLIHGPKS